MSPTIFNVLVDAVVHHWESLVAERAEGDSIKDDVAQPAVRTIRTSNNIRRQMEEEHTQLKVKAAVLICGQ